MSQNYIGNISSSAITPVLGGVSHLRDLGGWPHQTKNPCRNQPSLISSLLTKPSTIPSCNVAESLFLVVNVLSPIRWRGRRMSSASDRSWLLDPSPHPPKSVIGIWGQMQEWGCRFRKQLARLGPPPLPIVSALASRWNSRCGRWRRRLGTVPGSTYPSAHCCRSLPNLARQPHEHCRCVGHIEDLPPCPENNDWQPLGSVAIHRWYCMTNVLDRDRSVSPRNWEETDLRVALAFVRMTSEMIGIHETYGCQRLWTSFEGCRSAKAKNQRDHYRYLHDGL